MVRRSVAYRIELKSKSHAPAPSVRLKGEDGASRGQRGPFASQSVLRASESFRPQARAQLTNNAVREKTSQEEDQRPRGNARSKHWIRMSALCKEVRSD